MVKKIGSGSSNSDINEVLVENFVGLQHAMTNLSIKFGNLSDNISKLLEIFEEAAKNISKSGGNENEEITKKIDFLLDQNKTIARGLVMMEEKIRGQPPMGGPPKVPTGPQGQRPRPLPRL